MCVPSLGQLKRDVKKAAANAKRVAKLQSDQRAPFLRCLGKAKALEASRCYLSVSQMLLDNGRWYTRGSFPFFHCCIYKVCCKNSFFRMSKAVAVFQEIQDPQESHLCNLFVVMVVPVRGIQSLDCFKKRFQ